ncbi:hypothetical protein ACFCX0_11210 [Streptomyces sp. NPDC056352]|uniref:hypothetical protein n=1 Tax=Streptomyces sp. NPDC056352 TaxID=3345791 RepID=UPI0035D8FDF3
MPKCWTGHRERCRAARVPDDCVFATKGELARTMILRALASPCPSSGSPRTPPTARTPTLTGAASATSSFMSG